MDLLEDLLKVFSSRTGTSFESKVTHESNLLQLSSFLVSTIMADINGNVKQPVKVEMIDYLKQRLNVNTFDQNITTNKIRLDV